MKTEQIFPSVLIAMNFGAAIMFGVHGDIRKVVYFVAAAVLNITVTF